MSQRRIVSDAGPLISLEKLPDGFAFIRKLYDVIIIPPAVLSEVSAGAFSSGDAYVQYYRITDLIEVQSPAKMPTSPPLERLDEGEKQAIASAVELDRRSQGW